MTENAPTEKPLRRDAEENRRRLLAAAAEVFAEAGLDATLDEVAARAGVGVGTAYRRFANKEELLEALFRERVADLDAIMDRAAAAAEPWLGIVTYLEETIALTAGDRGLRELMLRPPQGLEFVDEARARLGPKIDELVERAHRAGALRAGVESSDLVMTVLMVSAVADYGQDRAEPPWRRFFALVVGGLRADAGGALPGAALSPAEADELLRAGRPGGGRVLRRRGP
ncbi:MAG: TetR/AcrR family transcriptional regulator [Actinobacteria bacterium]|nr:TetR/AcrR family transcriptional regulator [Actinomycetota bacterium]